MLALSSTSASVTWVRPLEATLSSMRLRIKRRIRNGLRFILRSASGSQVISLVSAMLTLLRAYRGIIFPGSVNCSLALRPCRVMRLTTVPRGGRYNSRAMRSNTQNVLPALEAKNISRLYKSSGRGVSDVSLRAELFEYFYLAEYADDRVKTYSYGMGKKLALIEALAHGPEVLLLDEPSLGLDYTSQLAYQR